MKTRFTRIFAACATAVALVSLPSVSASAGTLTSASFTTNGTGYAVTGASNARYDWRYTTATSGTTSRVEATVPAGTLPTGSKYLANSSVNYNFTSTPVKPAFYPATNALDLRVRVAPNQWSGSWQTLISQTRGSGNSYALKLTPSKTLRVFASSDGSNQINNYSTAVPGTTDGVPLWLRATEVADDAAGHHVVNFYTSTDGLNWNSFDSQTVAPAFTWFNSSSNLYVGGNGINEGVAGKIYFASVATSIAGTTSSASSCASSGVVACLNPNDYASGTSFTSSSPQAEVWSLNRNSSFLPEDIAADLSVAELAGLPSGGAASYRFIDAKATYVFPTATSIPAGTSTLLALAGFTNTATAGSYTSTITTFDNQAYPVALDSATTSALTFAALASSGVVGVAVDPTFSFTVASHSGACNSVSQTAGVTTGATGVALGRVNSASGSVAAQDLSVGTNANTGFSLQLRTSGPLTAGSNTIANTAGTNALPAAFPATTTAAFGYTVSGLSRFSSAWAGPETTNREVMNGATVGTVTNCIAYRVQVTASTPAGTYASTAYYTAIPTF